MANTLKQTESRIILIRHGETEWNRLHRFQGRSDIALNEKGTMQARALAKALQNEDITAIYTSPLKRAVGTAQHIKKFHTSLPLIKEPGFLEMDLGDFEGMAGKQWAISYPLFRAQWEKSPASLFMPGGESLVEVQSRAVQALKRISENLCPGSTSTIVICSHNFVITSLLCFVADISLNRFREMRQDTASLNVIFTDGMIWRIGTVNDRRHLETSENLPGR
jgi:phosphoserine phosphatase